MRLGFDERGIGMTLPCWISQRSATCASGRPLCGGDVREHRIAQHAAAAERAIGGEYEAALAARLQQLGLVEIGVILGLQRDQRLGAETDRLVEQRDVEVGDADMARQPLPLRLGERGDRLSSGISGLGQCTSSRST